MILKQYRQAKATCPEAVVLLRVGDFYEAFEDDAKLVAKVLGLRLATRRPIGGDDEFLMAGFPHHSLDRYVERLVAAGHRVAVCEQVERSKAKGHEVTRVVTNDADDALIETDTDPAATNPRPSTTVKCSAEKLGGEQRPTAAQ